MRFDGFQFNDMTSLLKNRIVAVTASGLSFKLDITLGKIKDLVGSNLRSCDSYVFDNRCVNKRIHVIAKTQRLSASKA